MDKHFLYSKKMLISGKSYKMNLYCIEWLKFANPNNIKLKWSVVLKSI